MNKGLSYFDTNNPSTYMGDANVNTAVNAAGGLQSSEPLSLGSLGFNRDGMSLFPAQKSFDASSVDGGLSYQSTMPYSQEMKNVLNEATSKVTNQPATLATQPNGQTSQFDVDPKLYSDYLKAQTDKTKFDMEQAKKGPGAMTYVGAFVNSLAAIGSFFIGNEQLKLAKDSGERADKELAMVEEDRAKIKKVQAATLASYSGKR